MNLFVLTAEEKRVICFIMLALLLGVAVKQYRKTHPPARPANPTIKELLRDKTFATPARKRKQTTTRRSPLATPPK